MSVSFHPLAEAGDASARLISEFADRVVGVALPFASGTDAVDRVRFFLSEQPEAFMAALVSAEEHEWADLAAFVAEEAGLLADANPEAGRPQGATYRELIVQGEGEKEEEYLYNKFAVCRATSRSAGASPEAARPASRAGIPSVKDLFSLVAQVFDNAKAAGGAGMSRSWRIKIESATPPEIGAENKRATHHVSFAARTRDGIKRVRDLVAAGRLSDATGTRYIDTATSLSPDQMIGLVYQHAHLGPTPKGRSSNEQVVCGQYAVLTLSAAGDEPESIDLYLSEGEPLRIEPSKAPATTRDGRQRSARACGWIGTYDPTGLVSATKREQRALAEAMKREQAAIDYSPATDIGRMIGDTAEAASKRSNAELIRENATLKKDIKQVSERIARLEAQMREMHDVFKIQSNI